MIQPAFTLACPLTIITVAVLSPNTGLGQAATQDWVEIGSTSDSVLFIDLGSIRQRQNAPSGWILSYYAKPEIVKKRSVGYSIDLYQADCSEDSIGRRSGTDYASSGEVINSYDSGFVDSKPVVPGSIGESILNSICRRDPSVIGPTEFQMTQRLNFRKLRNADGTALLPDGEWAMTSDGQLYQVVNKVWTPAIPPSLSDAAITPPLGLKRVDRNLRLIELTSSGWVSDDEKRRPIPLSELELRGGALLAVGGVTRKFLVREGRYFNHMHPIEKGFKEGDKESFGEVVFKFNGNRFTPSVSFANVLDALENARRTIPPASRPPVNKPVSKQKKR